jgi:hypothetical protein
MKDGPNREYFTELLEWTRSSAEVSEPTADDRVDAIAPMSLSYAQSISRIAKVEGRLGKPRTDMHCCGVVFDHHLVAHSEQSVSISW